MANPQDSLLMRAGKAIGAAGLEVIVWCESRAGYDRIMALGDLAGDFLSGILRRPRMRIHHNLVLALGQELTEAAHAEISGRVLRNFAKNCSLRTRMPIQIMVLARVPVSTTIRARFSIND